MAPLELTGILGWAERVINALGEWGVGLLVLLETVFPPLPSEVILPLAGFLTASGAISLPLVVVTAHRQGLPEGAAAVRLAGSLLWNGLLIGLGAALGSQYALVERYFRFLAYAVYGPGGLRGLAGAAGPAPRPAERGTGPHVEGRSVDRDLLVRPEPDRVLPMSHGDLPVRGGRAATATR